MCGLELALFPLSWDNRYRSSWAPQQPKIKRPDGREINPWKLSQAFSTLKYTKVQKYLPIPKSDMPREK